MQRRQSAHTQRAYRADVMAFVKFMGLTWPDQAVELLRASVQDVQDFRTFLLSHDAAPKTLNRRVSSLSSFSKYLAAAAAELRLPITVTNPAHAQFISRESTDPREETRALSAARARQLVGLPTSRLVFTDGIIPGCPIPTQTAMRLLKSFVAPDCRNLFTICISCDRGQRYLQPSVPRGCPASTAEGNGSL